jgi:hypothetical protein
MCFVPSDGMIVRGWHYYPVEIFSFVFAIRNGFDKEDPRDEDFY